MDKGFVAVSELLISDEQLSKSVEPGVRCFYDPAAVPGRTPALPLFSCDPGDVAPGSYGLVSWLAVISLIRIQEPFFPFGKIDDNGIEHCSELAGIMAMSPGNDQ